MNEVMKAERLRTSLKAVLAASLLFAVACHKVSGGIKQIDDWRKIP
jgi:hypothetical protein